MNRGILALGAAVVLAAAIGLYVLLRADDGGPVTRPVAGSADPSPVQKFAENAPDRPRLPSRTEYRIGDTRVRDHRAGEHAPIEAPPRVPRPDGREIPSMLTSSLGRGIRTALRPCAAGIVASALGPKPRIEGQILVSIRDHQATVTSSTLKLRDVADDARAQAEECLARSAVGFVAPAGDEPDVDDYSITLSLTLP